MVALRPSGRPPASKPTFVWHLGQLRYAPGDIRPNSSPTAVSPHFAQAYLLPGVGGRSLTGALCARREQRQLPTWRLPIKRRQRAPSTAPLANPGADQGWNWTPGTTRRDLLRAPERAYTRRSTASWLNPNPHAAAALLQSVGRRHRTTRMGLTGRPRPYALRPWRCSRRRTS